MFGVVRKSLGRLFGIAVLAVLFVLGFKFFNEYLLMQKIVANLRAESRLAEVLVVQSSIDEFTRKYTTTIKFLEYDVKGRPLPPKFFTFKGNLIQFQTLVVRFADKYVEQGHRMKGKSLHLFWKAFVLDGEKTQEKIITPVYETDVDESGQPRGFWERVSRFLKGPAAPTGPEIHVPAGYRVGNPPNYFEREVWRNFWKIALDPAERERLGIKNAQIEAPGSVFVPGTIYTLVIEHDGGVRIDTRPIPEVLK